MGIAVHHENASLTGRLLIASPDIGDENFERAVVLICAHDEHHAMGVVVNHRIASLSLAEILSQLELDSPTEFRDEPVFCGGPVQRERGLVIHSLDYRSHDTVAITSEVAVTSNKDILKEIAAGPANLNAPGRYFLAVGYAGWGGGQLEEELAMNAWSICDCEPELIFGGARRDVWSDAFATLGVTRAMLSGEWALRDSDDSRTH